MVVEHFTVKFDGEALSDHTMDVRDLAPALLALADAFATAHELLGDHNATPPSLEVKANREGSFDVELVIRTYEAARDLLNGPDAQAAGAAAALMYPVFGALRWLVRRGRGGREESRQEVEPGHLRVTWPDGTSIDTTVEAATLVDDMDFRYGARSFAEPLRSGDVERIELRPEKGDRVDIKPDDLAGFAGEPDEAGRLNVTEREVVLELRSVGLAEGHKWRVSDGGKTSFWVTLNDLDFIMAMDKGQERFAKYDRLRCILRERQSDGGSGRLTIERSIIKVLAHVRAPIEQALPFEQED